MQGDPVVNAFFEDIHGECATIEDFIVESAKIEFVAQLILGVLAEVEDFQLTDFVAESLGGPGDVAIGFGLDADFIFGRMIVEEVDDLLASPMFGMQAGIDDETNGAKHVVL